MKSNQAKHHSPSRGAVPAFGRYGLPEALLWLLGLGALALMNPEGEHMLSFCPFSWVWAEGCWGCGLGHAIAYLCRGQWQASWQAHPLALPVVLIMLRRCWQLLTLSSSKTHLH